MATITRHSLSPSRNFMSSLRESFCISHKNTRSGNTTTSSSSRRRTNSIMAKEFWRTSNRCFHAGMNSSNHHHPVAYSWLRLHQSPPLGKRNVVTTMNPTTKCKNNHYYYGMATNSVSNIIRCLHHRRTISNTTVVPYSSIKQHEIPFSSWMLLYRPHVFRNVTTTTNKSYQTNYYGAKRTNHILSQNNIGHICNNRNFITNEHRLLLQQVSPTPQQHQQKRWKHGMKTRSSITKRFRVRGNNSLVRSRSGAQHNTGYKSRSKSNHLTRSTTIKTPKVEKKMKRCMGIS